MTLEIGTPVTYHYPQDSYGAVVIKASAKQATIALLDSPSKTTGDEPSHFEGPFPVWTKTYTQDELESYMPTNPRTLKMTMRKDGSWKLAGSSVPVQIGQATYHRNHSY